VTYCLKVQNSTFTRSLLVLLVTRAAGMYFILVDNIFISR